MTGMPAASRRGRHRKPRPRKLLFAAGGLALAAGALSLVRITSDGGGVGAPGTAEAEPRLDPTAEATDRSANAAATVGTVLRATPSAATVMGGESTAPTATASRTAAASPSSASPTALPGTGTGTVPTTVPTAPTRPTGTPPPPAASPSPTPTPTPSAHQPGSGVCLPVVGLCVDPFAATAPRPGA
ncbi:hypothetical protein ACFY6U_34070 [Streptomyces sp. NPDC013157]|uniref:hypothetical protein n=1 Tax=Streptomyces sp. NPDC013157 TaxID=3364861 RepID=UPI003674571E